MRKIVDNSKVANIEIIDERWCDFCTESARVATSIEREFENDNGDVFTTTCADICYSCASQIAGMLAGEAETLEDGQLDI